MELNFHYSTGAGNLLNPADFKQRTALMKEAGVGTIWLGAYFFGHFDSDIETLVRMKAALEECGFEVNAISVPVGHPGNSLDPVNRPDMDCRIPSAWRYRVDAKGKPVHFCACVDETMLKDNMDAAAQLKQAGFKKVFYDDDLRMGNFGPQVQGCFCKECVERFNDSFGYSLTRAELAKAVLAPEPGVVCADWIDYNCGKITGFMRAAASAGPKPGIMVMHHGDRRHGIDIPAIKQAAPGCYFRVGEGNFNSREFSAFEGKVSLMESAAKHMALVGDAKRCYSESTVFPAEALAPGEWLERILIEIRLGLRNIFLMSGSWFLTEHYWTGLKQRLKEFREIAAFIDENPEAGGVKLEPPGS